LTKIEVLSIISVHYLIFLVFRFLIMTIDERKNKFKSLSYEKKREKILILLWKIQVKEKIIEETIKLIQENGSISESFLEDTYMDIIDFAEVLRNEVTKKLIAKLQKNRDAIYTIKEEEKDLKKKEHIEEILEQI